MVYVVWIVILIAAIIVDLSTSNMLFVWFGLGALIALILSLLNVSIEIQIITFILTGTILTLLIYPIFKKKLKDIPKTLPREDLFIGKEFIAQNQIKDKTQIMIDGTYWTAINMGETIEKGESFKIIKIDGVKLVIGKNKEGI